MKDYRILTMEDLEYESCNFYRQAEELIEVFPHIDWIVGEEQIFTYDNQYVSRVCLKVPQYQYKAARYLYQMKDNDESKLIANKTFQELQDTLSHLAHVYSFPIHNQKELSDMIDTIIIDLCDMYKLGTKLPNGLNLHLKPHWDEPVAFFEEDWNPSGFFKREMDIIQENLSFIHFETSRFFPMFEEVNPLLEPGIIYEVYQSFHSADGWGSRLLKTLKLLHSVKTTMIETESSKASCEELKGRKLKELAAQWVKERISNDHILDRYGHVFFTDSVLNSFDFSFYPNTYTFTVIDYSGMPDVFIQLTEEGMNFGFINTGWEGPATPVPVLKIKNLVSWETLEPLSPKEQETLIIQEFLKTVNLRRRQYKTCQFCNRKIPPGHLFNKKTCHSCATEFFGVKY